MVVENQPEKSDISPENALVMSSDSQVKMEPGKERDGRKLEDFCRANLGEYENKNAVKKDLACVIEWFPGFEITRSIQVDSDFRTHTYAILEGCLPITYKGNVYNIPLMVTFDHKHPEMPPYCTVRTPGNICVRPTRHVDASGTVVAPYLRRWTESESSVCGLLEHLQAVFGESCPVYSKTSDPGSGSHPSPVTQRRHADHSGEFELAEVAEAAMETTTAKATVATTTAAAKATAAKTATVAKAAAGTMATTAEGTMATTAAETKTTAATVETTAVAHEGIVVSELPAATSNDNGAKPTHSTAESLPPHDNTHAAFVRDGAVVDAAEAATPAAPGLDATAGSAGAKPSVLPRRRQPSVKNLRIEKSRPDQSPNVMTLRSPSPPRGSDVPLDEKLIVRARTGNTAAPHHLGQRPAPHHGEKHSRRRTSRKAGTADERDEGPCIKMVHGETQIKWPEHKMQSLPRAGPHAAPAAFINEPAATPAATATETEVPAAAIGVPLVPSSGGVLIPFLLPPAPRNQYIRQRIPAIQPHVYALPRPASSKEASSAAVPAELLSSSTATTTAAADTTSQSASNASEDSRDRLLQSSACGDRKPCIRDLLNPKLTQIGGKLDLENCVVDFEPVIETANWSVVDTPCVRTRNTVRVHDSSAAILVVWFGNDKFVRSAFTPGATVNLWNVHMKEYGPTRYIGLDNNSKVAVVARSSNGVVVPTTLTVPAAPAAASTGSPGVASSSAHGATVRRPPPATRADRDDSPALIRGLVVSVLSQSHITCPQCQGVLVSDANDRCHDAAGSNQGNSSQGNNSLIIRCQHCRAKVLRSAAEPVWKMTLALKNDTGTHSVLVVADNEFLQRFSSADGQQSIDEIEDCLLLGKYTLVVALPSAGSGPAHVVEVSRSGSA